MRHCLLGLVAVVLVGCTDEGGSFTSDDVAAALKSGGIKYSTMKGDTDFFNAQDSVTFVIGDEELTAGNYGSRPFVSFSSYPNEKAAENAVKMSEEFGVFAIRKGVCVAYVVGKDSEPVYKVLKSAL